MIKAGTSLTLDDFSHECASTSHTTRRHPYLLIRRFLVGTIVHSFLCLELSFQLITHVQIIFLGILAHLHISRTRQLLRSLLKLILAAYDVEGRSGRARPNGWVGEVRETGEEGEKMSLQAREA